MPICTFVRTRIILLRFRLMYDVLLGHVSSSCTTYIFGSCLFDFGYIFLFLVSYMNCDLIYSCTSTPVHAHLCTGGVHAHGPFSREKL